eukprot:CAMPEP_0168712172 /NCGR_PEP_ID=MMETSP0503-20121227/43524_1 /TAXON_ID=89963 /ORGANISM="Heterocapsa rotundata, Strain SCCAP K-0483" /LENGTH=278 /DNA_ID=CAMNT_0008758543 /DNA_START=6 /DNA_END=838 /DNA_ORIENTATION=+
MAGKSEVISQRPAGPDGIPSLARLQQLQEIIEKTPSYLRAVTLSIRSVWQLKTKQIPALTKFREEFLKDASVLKKFMVPFTLAVLTGLDRLFDEYVKCDFDTWNGVISDIGDIALEYERLCYCLLEWYEHILEDLKKLPDLVAAFTAEVPPEILQCQQMAKIQYVKHNISDGTFVSLLFIPEVGEIVAPLMATAGVAKRGSVEPTIVHGQFEVAAGAVLSTTETLVPAVAKVMSNLRFIHNVFKEFTEQFEELVGDPEAEGRADSKSPEAVNYKQGER